MTLFRVFLYLSLPYFYAVNWSYVEFFTRFDAEEVIPLVSKTHNGKASPVIPGES